MVNFYLGVLKVGGFDTDFGPFIEVFDEGVFKSPGLPPRSPGRGIVGLHIDMMAPLTFV